MFAATTPFAPSMPTLKSAMCIEPPLPPQLPPCAAEQLAHHGERVGALGEGVAVAAMGREQHVVAGEVGADARRDRLLADRRMDRPEHELLPQALERQLLEGADAPHEAVVRRQALDVEIGRDALVHLDEPPIRLSGGALALRLALAGHY